MEITGIRYGRKFNLGNYESEEIAFEAVLDEGESPLECLEQLKSAVLEAFKGETSEPPKKEKAAEKKEAPKKAPAKKAAKAEEPEEGDAEFIDTEEETEEGEKPAKKEPAKKKATKKKAAKKQKNTPYNRDLELHKKLVGEMLTAELPAWKTDKELKKSCKNASTEMEGEDFLDSDGKVLDSFKQEFLSLVDGL